MDIDSGYDKIYQEIDSKIIRFETNMSGFYGEWSEGADSYRMIPRVTGKGKPKSLFNSRVGETNRAANTLADVWFRMLTSADPFFEARGRGLDAFGQEISQGQLYAIESLIARQMEDFKFKKNLRRSLVSLAMFGLDLIEEPWLRNRRTGLEGTGFFQKSLLQSFFDSLVFDVELSRYVGFIDYLDPDTIRWMAKSMPSLFDEGRVERGLFELKNMNKVYQHDAWSRIVQRKQRSWYNSTDYNAMEFVSYHGALDSSDNPVLSQIWEQSGRQQFMDIRDTDWSIKCVGRNVVSVYPTPYGSWQSIVKSMNANLFEMEPIGYMISRIGKKYQKELDFLQSKSNDLAYMTVANMWKVGRYAGLRQGSIPITPYGIVNVDKVDELQPLRPPAEVLPLLSQIMGIMKEDYRSVSGAKTNLQAENTGGTATEASLSQVEALRSAGVATEIISETIREHIEDSYLNNLNLLDQDVWLNVAGINKPVVVNKEDLPYNIGFNIKLTTDRDFRTQRIPNLIQALSFITSIRNDFPEGLNLIRPLASELIKGFGIDPRLLSQPVPIADQLLRKVRNPQPTVLDELGDDLPPENNGKIQTPVGEVPTSPLNAAVA